MPKATKTKYPLAEVEAQVDKDSESRAHAPPRNEDIECSLPFPGHLLDGTELDPVDALRKVFTPALVTEQYWRLVFGQSSYKRKDGTERVRDEPTVRLKTLDLVCDRIAGKPAVALPAAGKLPDQADDITALMERAKASPALRAQMLDQFRKLMLELEKLDVEGKKA